MHVYWCIVLLYKATSLTTGLASIILQFYVVDFFFFFVDPCERCTQKSLKMQRKTFSVLVHCCSVNIP